MTEMPNPEPEIWDPKRLTLRWFEYDHLPEDLQEIAHPIYDLADALYERLGDGAERSAGFRKLLEAKDCFVRQGVADRPRPM